MKVRARLSLDATEQSAILTGLGGSDTETCPALGGSSGDRVRVETFVRTVVVTI
jgi:hypothetical protein